MKCPHCNETLVMTSREGIEIDYCPKCRGVWLDRGELDKIIEKSAPAPSNANVFEKPSREYDRDDDYKYKKHGKYKNKSFLGDLFDF